MRVSSSRSVIDACMRRASSSMPCSRPVRRVASSDIALFQQAAGRADDRGQWRTEVVGDAGQERIAQALRFGVDRGPGAAAGEQRALERQRRLVGECVEQSTVLGRGETLRGQPHGQYPKGPPAPCSGKHRRCSSAVGASVLSVPWPESKACCARSISTCAEGAAAWSPARGRSRRDRSAALVIGQQQRDLCPEHRPYRGGQPVPDVRLGLRRDQVAGQFVERLGPAGASVSRPASAGGRGPPAG